jgi:hypothetical protein
MILKTKKQTAKETPSFLKNSLLHTPVPNNASDSLTFRRVHEIPCASDSPTGRQTGALPPAPHARMNCHLLQPSTIATPTPGDREKMASHPNLVDFMELAAIEIPQADPVEGKVAFQHRVNRTGLFVAQRRRIAENFDRISIIHSE